MTAAERDETNVSNGEEKRGVQMDAGRWTVLVQAASGRWDDPLSTCLGRRGGVSVTENPEA
eukprot:6200722-Pleurochrysis_carterae.AAC.7